MRVISVVNWLNRGGIETQLLQAIPTLRGAGIDMDICTTAPGSLDGEYARQGCKIWRVPKSPNCLVTAKHFQRVLAQRPYDCVHCNLDHASGGYALGAARAGVPIAVSFHSAVPGSLSAWRNKPVLAQVRQLWLRWHRRLMERNVRIFVGHSETNLRAYAPDWKDHPRRYRTLMNGVSFPASLPDRDEARQALGLKGNALVLLHVGSFRPAKNHAGLLRIFEETLRRRPDATLLLVGDGPLCRAVDEQSQRMGLRERVRFEGAVANVWPYYAAADVFVFPSEVEGFGNVLVECQGVGTPIVASALPALRESVAPGQHRFLFPLPDYARAAELVVEQATAAAERSNDWVAVARDHVRQRFSIERFANALQQLYLDLQAA